MTKNAHWRSKCLQQGSQNTSDLLFHAWREHDLSSKHWFLQIVFLKDVFNTLRAETFAIFGLFRER